MSTKKNYKNQGKSFNKKQNTVPSIYARIDRLVDYEDSKIKAIASVNIGRSFAIHGIKVMDSEKGLFVSMPSESYEKNGNTEYKEIFHPITAKARTELNNKVLEAYEQRLSEEQDEDEGENENEDEEESESKIIQHA